jgi:hypothetical protein
MILNRTWVFTCSRIRSAVTAGALIIGVGVAGGHAAEVADAERFDLHAQPRVLLEGKILHEPRVVPQSFAFDEVGGCVYVLQVEGTNDDATHAEHDRRGDLVLTKLTLEGGKIVGHMTLRGFGHGVAMGVERDGADIFLWTEVDSDPGPYGTGRGKKLARFRFANGETLRASSKKLQTFAPSVGARNCTPSIDGAHGRLGVRYVTPQDEWSVAVFDLAAFKAGNVRPLGQTGLRAVEGTAQGWCLYGDNVYVYTGTAYGPKNPPPGNATLWCVDWRSGQLVGKQKTDTLHQLQFREPEGLAVFAAADGPRLCFGFGAIDPANNRRRLMSIAWLPLAIAGRTNSDEPETFSGGSARSKPFSHE